MSFGHLGFGLWPLDYYLWCAVKDKCYADKSETIDALKDNIREAIGEIQLHTIDNKLKNFLFTKIEEEDIDNILFQQDSATYHTAEFTADVLRPVFEDCIISRRADIVWLPRSCDLPSLDYY